MASCCRRYRARRLKILGDDPQLLVIRPAPPATSLYHLKPFKLSTALMAVHKDCYAPIGLIQQGGPRRRETLVAELTRSADIQLNKRHSWRRRSNALSLPHRIISPNVRARPGKAVKRSYSAWRLCSSIRKQSREQQKISAAKAKRHSLEIRRGSVVGPVSRDHPPPPGSSRSRSGSVSEERRNR